MAAERTGVIRSLIDDSANIIMVFSVMGVLMAMLLPIPGMFLDFLLALNITVSIIILVTTMYAKSPLEFSIFPSVLLLLTLFRLSLNLASTRLILLKGNEGASAAGAIIQTFGSFVVGGSYVVGLIVFIILVLINFTVITKGSGRIAEVAARFTLDAMPGKQMAIDADLNAGLIDENEAKTRRKNIAREAEFYGAMDGASKFVRGDAVAGIIITFINIIGGFFIGVFQKNMSMTSAAESYTILTIGDGLVSQIPALIISTGAGILVSRSGAEEKMGTEFGKHIFSNPNPIYIGAFVIFLFGLVPGLPTIPFITLALLTSFIVYFFKPEEDGEEEQKKAEAEARAREAKDFSGPEQVEHLLHIDRMELEVGYGLIPIVDKQQNGALLDRIRSIRRQFATEMGVIVPPIHIRDNLKLRPAQYRLLIKGVEVGEGEVMVNHLLAMDPGTVAQKIDGIPTTEPAFNLPALWIRQEKEDDARFAGYTVVDNATVIATHLTEMIRSNAFELLGRQEVQHLLDNLAKDAPKAVEELVPSHMSLGTIQKVLQNLVRERVSIRDLLSVVECLSDYSNLTKDPDLLTEYVRQKLARSIVSPFVQKDGIIYVITIEPRLEETLTKNVHHSEHGSYLSIDPGTVDSVMLSVKEESQKIMNMNLQPVILCSPILRRHLKKIVEQISHSITVISHAEVLPNISIKATGKVTIKNGS
ncbi:MAG: flagellar biosynthesis protein FlhA [Desulfobacterales bacterium]|nr:flagellar biosynthesis protein FlhA [Desulfobacterales bacterium]